MHRSEFFELLWKQYTQVTPQAQKIQSLLQSRGEIVTNDHVAFRTFNIDGYDLQAITPLLESLGYQVFDSYQFPDKHLRALAFIVPDDPTAPRVFFSELLCEAFGAEIQSIIQDLTSPLDDSLSLHELLGSYPFKTPTLQQYSTLADASEYAGWLSTMGYQANHFTVDINALNTLHSIDDVIHLLEAHHYPLNAVGGIKKGLPEDLLVQASTLADSVTFTFADGQQQAVPSCFYEFAHRFADRSGELFQGFVPNNANTIFESTDRR
ncbi:DUF1338 domain-containing protein [Litoricolaceae bacterium]|jgi:hypothetical protein|nr:DUF1338 domain-containing protein [Litorivicinaceae bacterium]